MTTDAERRTRIALRAAAFQLDDAENLLLAIDGCPEGTTCPVCRPVREAARLTREAFASFDGRREASR